MRKKIGNFLQELGLISQKDVMEIRKYSESTGKKFGESAIDLGILTEEQLQEIFGPHYETDFFHLSPHTFSVETKDLLNIDEIVEFGTMPLGTQGLVSQSHYEPEALNFGMLNPTREEIKKLLLPLAHARFGDDLRSTLRIFLVIPSQFVEIVEKIYKVKPMEILTRFKKVEPVLREYLERRP